MEVMYMLIAFSLLIASGFLLAFIWAIRNGQYDDKYTPSVRMLFDDEPETDSDRSEQNEGKQEIKSKKVTEKSLSLGEGFRERPLKEEENSVNSKKSSSQCDQTKK